MTLTANRVGIYFGAATLFGLAGWAVLGGEYPQWADWTFVAIGAVFFFFLDDLVAQLNPRWRVVVNAIGYLVTALFAFGFGAKLWFDVG